MFNFTSQTPRKEHAKVQIGVSPCLTQDGERLFTQIYNRPLDYGALPSLAFLIAYKNMF